MPNGALHFQLTMANGRVMTTGMVVSQAEIKRRPELEIFDDSIVAKPLGDDAINGIRLLDPTLELRCVNFVVGDGLNLRQKLAQGWLPATDKDVQAPGWLLKDGAYKNGDLILMKHKRTLVLGHRKYNVERALKLGGKNVAFDKANGTLRTDLAGATGPSEAKKKMGVFTPSQKEVEGLVGKPDKE